MASSVDLKKIIYQCETMNEKQAESSISNGKGGVSFQRAKVSAAILNHYNSWKPSFPSESEDLKL